MDTLGSEWLNSLENSAILYKYKDCIQIPPLEMIDALNSDAKIDEKIKMRNDKGIGIKKSHNEYFERDLIWNVSF